jgi:hypothetical protein
MASYKTSSPYYISNMVNNQFLDIMEDRHIPKSSADILFVINQTYHLRPDLLASDLYNDPGLWWVFATRNPNRLKDPLFDFIAGTSIYLPQYSVLRSTLGI